MPHSPLLQPLQRPAPKHERSEANVIRVGVVGARGYVGAELVRWILSDPTLELCAVVSRSDVGQPLAAMHPGLLGLTELEITAFSPSTLSELDAVFLAVPHGAAAPLADALDAAGCPIIVDASRDHRHAPGWVYGQPEWSQQALSGAKRIAAPGCFATAIALALAPFVDQDLITGPVTVCAATGSTGSGASPSAGTHHPLRFANIRPYKVLRHQHVPEICGFLSSLGEAPQLAFTPVSAPIDRGILATCFIPVTPGIDPQAVLHAAYDPHPLIRVRDGGPEVRHVRGTGFCDISGFACPDDDPHAPPNVVSVISAIDNLGRGAAAQAVQALHVALGRPPTTVSQTPPNLP